MKWNCWIPGKVGGIWEGGSYRVTMGLDLFYILDL
jgi:ubiquitin-protein ligase